jgi:hypothetical protein
VNSSDKNSPFILGPPARALLRSSLLTWLVEVLGPQGTQASLPTVCWGLMMVLGGQLSHTPVPLTM